MKEDTWHIHIKGQVQGVGFRPFVYKKAVEFGLTGWVNNAIDGVHCEFNADRETARQFYRSLISNAPELSSITGHELQQTGSKSFDAFQIIHSQAKGQANLLLTPDFAMCDDCREELFAPTNRRRGYPFITCTNCGPRYSIIQKLPYDRETTTMEPFRMCAPCQTEYENPLDRRYYSQTNSCETCGISLSLYDAQQKLLATGAPQIINKVVAAWQARKIVAIKGIGGYLLTCDATDAAVIKKLRQRKRRPTKPFALMYPDIETLEKDVVLREEEKQLLTNAISPIVLADVKENPAPAIRHPPSGIRLPEITPGPSRLGVMLPYTPIYAMLLEEFGGPIIATSGNISGSPIIYDDKKALDELTQVADVVLANNRAIAVPQDDSVITFTPCHRQKIIYRRSRGLAPTYINPKLELPEETVLATGAMLKSSFTYLHQQNIFISQYLGDLDHFDTQQSYRRIVQHFFQLFDEKPEVVLADRHPNYFSTRFAGQLADELGVAVKKYQHHKAHFAAVLGEHALLDSDEPILGVIWDGTGLGDDGQIWGGEFFNYQDYTFNRCGHFDYFNFIAGDKMPREPRISALAATQGVDGADDILRSRFTDLEWKNYHTLLQKTDGLKTSSVGRLFDAASSLLDIKDRQSYEGEAAMLLEKLARQYVNEKGTENLEGYLSDSQNLSPVIIMQGMIRDLQHGVDRQTIAGRFHFSLVQAISLMADQQDSSTLAFSGGVFQNALLVDLIIDHFGSDYELYFHQNLSPNDENISFGQLMCYVLENSCRAL